MDNTNVEQKFVKKKYRAWNAFDDLLSQKKEKQFVPFFESETTQETDIKQESNKQQTDNNRATKREQTDNKVEYIGLDFKETDNKSTSISITNQKQTDNKLRNKSYDQTAFSLLVGLQRELVLVLYNICHLKRSKSTGSVTLEYLSNITKHDKNTIKVSLQRLESKNIINRHGFKAGRGGWSIYEIPDDIYQEIVNMPDTSTFIKNKQQTDNIIGTKPYTELTTATLSSSSNYINTTTDNKDDNFSFSDEWKYIDIEPLVDIGFTESQLKQLAKAAKLTPLEVQESIYAFAYARKQPEIAKSIRTNHLNFLMGVLIKKGEPYLPPTGYKSPLDIAIQEDIERKKKKLALEAELNDLKFQEWYNFLTKEEKEKLFVQELTDEEKELYFDKNARYMPEHVKENKRKEVLRPYFMNVIRIV